MRALPWIQEAREKQSDFLRCDECMANDGINTSMRRAWGCGFMPVAARTNESLWTPDDGTELTMCAGYTTSLPDVVDVACNFAHWENGALDHVCPDGVPKPLLDGLTLFKASGDARASYRMKESQKNGGNRG